MDHSEENLTLILYDEPKSPTLPNTSVGQNVS